MKTTMIGGPRHGQETDEVLHVHAVRGPELDGPKTQHFYERVPFRLRVNGARVERTFYLHESIAVEDRERTVHNFLVDLEAAPA